MRLDVVTREQSDSISALLGILHRFGYVAPTTGGSVIWWLPQHWSVRQKPDGWGSTICAYDLSYTRKK